ncbi:4968_t:CDS:1, partial [Ambispora leptoticha]
MSEDLEDFVSTHEAFENYKIRDGVKNLQIKLGSISMVGRLIMQLWMDLRPIVFKIGAEMRILVVSFTSQPSPNSTVRDNIYNIFPNAFFISPPLQAQHSTAQLNPIGTAWILTKVGVRKSDFGVDNRFFYF